MFHIDTSPIAIRLLILLLRMAMEQYSEVLRFRKYNNFWVEIGKTNSKSTLSHNYTDITTARSQGSANAATVSYFYLFVVESLVVLWHQSQDFPDENFLGAAYFVETNFGVPHLTKCLATHRDIPVIIQDQAWWRQTLKVMYSFTLDWREFQCSGHKSNFTAQTNLSIKTCPVRKK